MAKLAVNRRRKQDLQERYSIRIQGGRAGLVEATSRMDIHEFRVFATMLTMVLPEDEDFTEYEIRIQDIIKLFSLHKDGRYYEIIRDAAQRLMDRRFVIYEVKEDGEEYKTTIHLIDETSEPVRAKAQTHIRLRFNPKLKPYLLQLKREYLTIDVRNIVDINSPYSIKLYMVLKHQQKLGNTTVRYTVERLRQILAIEDDEYPLYGNFKQKVLKKSVDDINRHTDLNVNGLDEEKTGRAVTSVRFHLEEQASVSIQQISVREVRRNTVRKANEAVTVIEVVNSQEESSGGDRLTPAQEELLEYIITHTQGLGITRATAIRWLQELPLPQIRLGVDHVLNEVKTGKKVGNPGGYINKMVNNPTLYDAFLASRQAEDQQRRQQADQERRRQNDTSLELQRTELSERIDTQRRVLLLHLIRSQATLHREVLQRMQTLAEDGEANFMQKWTWEQYLLQGFNAAASQEEFIRALEVCGMSFFLSVWQQVSLLHPQLHQRISEQFGQEAEALAVDLSY